MLFADHAVKEIPEGNEDERGNHPGVAGEGADPVKKKQVAENMDSLPGRAVFHLRLLEISEGGMVERIFNLMGDIIPQLNLFVKL